MEEMSKERVARGQRCDRCLLTSKPAPSAGPIRGDDQSVAVSRGTLRVSSAPGPDPVARDAVSAADVAALMLLGFRTDPGPGSFDSDAAAGWLDHSSGSRAERRARATMCGSPLNSAARDVLAWVGRLASRSRFARHCSGYATQWEN
jgi:hypothetical protein